MFHEDVKFMSDTGLQAYIFSISWSRLLPSMEHQCLQIHHVQAYWTNTANVCFPDGRGAVNLKGLKNYNDLINKLIEHGMFP